MATTQRSNRLMSAFGQLVWPVLVGVVGTVVFYAVLLRGPIESPLAIRYFTSHPVSYVATGMFVVGLVALAMKTWDVLGQYGMLPRVTLGLDPGETISVEKVPELLEQMAGWPARVRQSYLGQRLESALRVVAARRTADGLDDELKYLADVDAARQHESFALVRILIWATPMLGFLGTVIGITQALGNLDPQELATSVQTAMDKLLSGLYVAFDTTALALTLSIALMFVQFIVDRVESALLSAVDERVQVELRGRFGGTRRSSDPQVAAVEQMSEAVIRTTEVLVKQQVALWESALESAEARWTRTVSQATEQISDGLRPALDAALVDFAERLRSASYDAAAVYCEEMEKWRDVVVRQAEQLEQANRLAAAQQETWRRTIDAAGDVVSLQQSLNENLQSLAAAGQFEEAVVSLSATVQLLAARLGAPGSPRRVDLPAPADSERAA